MTVAIADFIGRNTIMGITGATVVVKSGPATVFNVNVIAAGTTNGGIYNSKVTTGLSNANQVANIPNAAGVYAVNTYCSNGIVVNPGAAQTLSITYS